MKPERVDNIYVINMDKDVERLKLFMNLMKDWSPIRFSAITKDLDENQSLLKEEFISKITLMSYGEIGCFLSHVSLWKMLVESDMKRILIFEDDAKTFLPLEKVRVMIDDLYNYFDLNNIEEPDILYLGKSHDECSRYEKIMGDVYRNFKPLGLHAYIITSQGAEKLLSQKRNFSPVDKLIINKKKKLGLEFMTFHPSLFFQDSMTFSSNLRSDPVSYSHYNECKVSTLDTADHCIQSNYFSAFLGLVFIICFIVVMIVLYKNS